MSAWTRLYITVEGHAERKFADDLLRPYFAAFEIDLRSCLVVTNRKLGKRGGVLSFPQFAGDLARRMREDRQPEARFTTMIDLYALPAEFPGWSEARKLNAPEARVGVLEAAWQQQVADPRFIPHIQLHEFEALLFCDLSQLRARIADSDRAIATLQAEVAGLAPERIDEGKTTAPSQRIIRHIPNYEDLKVRVGAPAAAAIGLPTLRARCPHFAGWLRKLEALGTTPH
ncbi:DUF4276 family protein [Nannocystis sp.]|uniref:DUF4276 family protein n=1 Tax=Nannocystis sp. TaxID=1962667 RepID=UPI0025ECB9D5|nr:DUF4276 family protein [Nannocystis sp.]MBK7828980.1 DUF4276 family protein [Nannocystis sp.]